MPAQLTKVSFSNQKEPIVNSIPFDSKIQTIDAVRLFPHEHVNCDDDVNSS